MIIVNARPFRSGGQLLQCDRVYRRLYQANVELVPAMRATAFRDGEVTLENAYGGPGRQLGGIDAVVYAAPRRVVASDIAAAAEIHGLRSALAIAAHRAIYGCDPWRPSRRHGSLIDPTESGEEPVYGLRCRIALDLGTRAGQAARDRPVNRDQGAQITATVQARPLSLEPNAKTGDVGVIHGKLITGYSDVFDEDIPHPLIGVQRFNQAAILRGSAAADRRFPHTRSIPGDLRDQSIFNITRAAVCWIVCR